MTRARSQNAGRWLIGSVCSDRWASPRYRKAKCNGRRANFGQLLDAAPFGLFYLNSVKVTLCITLGHLVFCFSAAYAFARLRFRGREVLFAAYLSSLLVPGQVTIIPLYVIIRALGLLD